MPILGAVGAASAKGFGLTNGQFSAYIAVSHATSPYLTIYPWGSQAGFGTKVANPASLPAGNGQCVAFSPAGTEVVVGVDASPYIAAYPWSSSGFGTKFSDPATLPSSAITSVAFNLTGTVLFTLSSSGVLRAYNWSSSGFGSSIASVSTGLSGNGIAVSPDGNNVSVAGSSSPYMKTFPWDGSSFGSAYAGSSLGSTGISASFSPLNNALAVGVSSTSGLKVLQFTDGVGYGSTFTTAQNAPELTFDDTGDYVFYASTGTFSAGAMPWTGSGFGSAIALPSGGNIGTYRGISASRNSRFVAFAGNTSPYVAANLWAGTAWGADGGTPATPPAGTPTGVAVCG